MKASRRFGFLNFLAILGLGLGPQIASAHLIPFAMMRAMYYENNAVDFPEGALVSVGPGLSLVMQADGNFVMYGSSGALWASGTYQACNFQCFGAFQPDGNLVLYFGGIAYWSSGTGGNPTAKLRASAYTPYLKIVAGGSVLWSVP